MSLRHKKGGVAVLLLGVYIHTYTEDAGCAITMGIPMKFHNAHGRSRPEVGSAKCINFYGSGGFPGPGPTLHNTQPLLTYYLYCS